jgi:hypothetical protein
MLRKALAFHVESLLIGAPWRTEVLPYIVSSNA